MKLLKRSVIIREYDYDKNYNSYRKIYHRSSFKPMTIDDLEKEYLVHLLKHGSEKNLLGLNEPVKKLLWHLRRYMYDTKYIAWVMPDQGDSFVWIQARKSTPVTRLGWAVFEMDYQ